MKKVLLSSLTFAMTFAWGTSNAQLANGSVAPNFTITAYQPGLASAGMNNNGTYTLYDYLDAGYTVIMDVSATWCGPCWNYHIGGAFDDFFANHGPAGHPGVSGGTTDDAMVIWIEGDGTTADATMLDGAGSIGNWINPSGSHEIEFPMANPASAAATQINNDYSIGYFPTIYKICPNRILSEVGQQSATNLYASVGQCPPPASDANDPALLSYLGVNKACGPVDLVVKLQNNGTSAMTACTITAMEGATQVAQYNWTGNLPKYGIADVTIGTFTPTSATHNLSISISSADDNASNNTLTQSIGLANKAGVNNVTVKVNLDRYGSETSWKIFRSNGTVAYTSPTYTDAGANGTYPQADINISLPNDCYSLKVYDSYGDGFDSGYGDGSVQVFVGASAIAGVTSFPSGTEKMDAFETAATAGIEEMRSTTVKVYPNPASSVVNVAFEANAADYTVSIVDLQGRVVLSNVYSNLSGAQSLEIPVSQLVSGNYLVNVSSNGVTIKEMISIK